MSRTQSNYSCIAALVKSLASVELQVNFDTLAARVEAVDGLARLPALIAGGLHNEDKHAMP